MRLTWLLLAVVILVALYIQRAHLADRATYASRIKTSETR